MLLSSQVLLTTAFHLGVARADDAPTGANVTGTEAPPMTIDPKQPPEGFGIGIAPPGLTVAWREGTDWALQGEIFYYRQVYASVDVLRTVVLFDANEGKLRIPLYVGLGGRLQTWDRVGHWRDHGFDNSGLGAHVPIGVALLPKYLFIDPYIQVAPGLVVVPGIGFVIDPSLGIRIYF